MLGTSVAVFAPQMSHATVIYSEAVSGDLPGDQNFPTLVGSFIVGTNSILGHDSLGTDILSQGDTFGLTLGAGQHIDSILLTITSNTNTADAFAATIFESPFTQVKQFVEPAGTTGAIGFTPFASQSPGQYNFSIQYVTANQPTQGFNWHAAFAMHINSPFSIQVIRGDHLGLLCCSPTFSSWPPLSIFGAQSGTNAPVLPRMALMDWIRLRGS